EVTRALKELEPSTGPRVLATGFSAAGDRIWACRADGRVRSWTLPEFRDGPGWAADGSSIRWSAARFTHRAERLAAGDETGAVRVFSADGQVERALEGVGDHLPVEALAWSEDGRLLAAGYKGGDIQLWDDAGKLIRRQSAFPVGVDHLEFAADGRWL